MKDQDILDNAPVWADSHRKELLYPDSTTYLDNKYEDRLDRSLADIKRIVELEESNKTLMQRATDLERELWLINQSKAGE